MSLAHSFSSGLRRVVGSPALVLWLYLAMLLATLPPALALRGILKEAIGSSLVHENLRNGFDLAWHGEFAFERDGLADTFGPSVVGILPVLNNLEKLLDGEILQMPLTLLLPAVVFLLAWAFFAGGILDRYARADELHSRSRFFGRGADYCFRFVRLLAISLLLYWALFRWVANPLHRWLEDATRDVMAERTVMLYTLLVYVLVAFLLLLLTLVLDYAKISLVVEERRSALLALVRGARFVWAHPGKTFGLYLGLTLVGLGLVLLYSAVAPGPGQSQWSTVTLAFLLGQLYMLARLGLKLWFLASQTVLFQSAHPRTAGLTAGLATERATLE